jgi:hypothetical protein
VQGEPAAGAALVDRLLREERGTVLGSGAAWRLSVSDIDRLLAAIYTALFGDRIESQLECDSCGKGFELQLSLAELVREALAAGFSGVRGPETDGERFVYALSSGVRFRLPTPLDQLETAGAASGAEEVLRRCIVEGELTPSVAEEVEAAMARVAPVLRLDIEAACAECGARQSAHFDIEAFLIGALDRERRWLYREVHALAVAYGWSPSDILALSRTERRAYVALVQAARAAQRESVLS